ncbi:replication protein A subunit A-like protein [Carex littledalei]|uniref:Replication protein A subunit A-like protein n=1 Tax=Carex littledalei TaxID=544730 RepID=A0A833QG91_9POAL|nr:replication protein A subunit A-like protein [Carex littledalei]
MYSSQYDGGAFSSSQSTQSPDSSISKIVLVGMVCNKASRATDGTFTHDDGTGRMDFIRWVNDASDASETAIIENGMYVSIVGSFKGFNERKRATAFAIRPVKDNNQIVLHFIQCVLENTKLKVGSLTQPQQSLVNGSYLSSGSPQTPVSTKASGNSTAHGSETDIYKLVLDVFQEPSSVEAIDYHVDVGHIYSTIDDFHFKSACVD